MTSTTRLEQLSQRKAACSFDASKPESLLTAGDHIWHGTNPTREVAS